MRQSVRVVDVDSAEPGVLADLVDKRPLVFRASCDRCPFRVHTRHPAAAIGARLEHRRYHQWLEARAHVQK